MIFLLISCNVSSYYDTVVKQEYDDDHRTGDADGYGNNHKDNGNVNGYRHTDG